MRRERESMGSEAQKICGDAAGQHTRAIAGRVALARRCDSLATRLRGRARAPLPRSPSLGAASRPPTLRPPLHPAGLDGAQPADRPRHPRAPCGGLACRRVHVKRLARVRPLHEPKSSGGVPARVGAGQCARGPGARPGGEPPLPLRAPVRSDQGRGTGPLHQGALRAAFRASVGLRKGLRCGAWSAQRAAPPSPLPVDPLPKPPRPAPLRGSTAAGSAGVEASPGPPPGRSPFASPRRSCSRPRLRLRFRPTLARDSPTAGPSPTRPLRSAPPAPPT